MEFLRKYKDIILWNTLVPKNSYKRFYNHQSWIFKSFSDAAADAGIDATHKIAIFK